MTLLSAYEDDFRRTKSWRQEQPMPHNVFTIKFTHFWPFWQRNSPVSKPELLVGSFLDSPYFNQRTMAMLSFCLVSSFGLGLRDHTNKSYGVTIISITEVPKGHTPGAMVSAPHTPRVIEIDSAQ